MPETRNYISKITTTQGTFYLKDSEARDLIAAISGQIQFNLSTNAATTPKDVTWDNNGTLVTGTLVPATNTGTQANPVWVPTTGYYLVPQTNATGQDYYSEYIVVSTGSSGTYGGYEWEKLGDTEIDFSSLGALAYKDSVTLNKQTINVIPSGYQLEIPSLGVQNGAVSTDTFVKSYPGSSQKLETTTITGTNGTESVSVVTKVAKTATNLVLGNNTTASKIATVAKTATNTVFGDSVTASYATPGTPVNVAKKGSSVNTSRITLADGQNSILGTATVDTSTETLTIGTSAVTQNSVIGCDSTTQSITPYSFADRTVPQVTSNDSVDFDAVSTNTSVTVPVVSSNTTVNFDAVNSITSKTVAKVAANAITVATGKTTSTDANGDTVLIGLGTPTTNSAMTGLPSLATEAETVTLTSDSSVLRSTTDVVVS